MEVLDNQTPQNAPVVNTQEQAPVISVGEWLLTILILALPLINIIMLFVWAFGGGTNKTKANYCKAALVWFAIAIVLYICFFSVIMAAFMAASR